MVKHVTPSASFQDAFYELRLPQPYSFVQQRHLLFDTFEVDFKSPGEMAATLS
jgi:hypothetical protein